MEQPLLKPAIRGRKHKRFTRYKGSGAVAYQRSPSEKDYKNSAHDHLINGSLIPTIQIFIY